MENPAGGRVGWGRLEAGVAKGTLFVMTGASGVGKGTLRARLMERVKLYYSISMTTRPPRPGERHGVDYWFVDRERFLALREQGAFLESAEYVGRFYGTPRAPVERHLAKGEDVLLEIEVEGAKQVKARAPELGIHAVFLFVVPPSLSELRRRLLFRSGHLDEAKLREIEARLARAEREIAEAGELGFDYVVVNDVLEEAVAALDRIVRSERLKAYRQQEALARALVRHPELEAELDEMERWMVDRGGTRD